MTRTTSLRLLTFCLATFAAATATAAGKFGTYEKGACVNDRTRVIWARYYEVNPIGSAEKRCEGKKGYKGQKPRRCRRDAGGVGMVAEWHRADSSCARPPPPSALERAMAEAKKRGEEASRVVAATPQVLADVSEEAVARVATTTAAAQEAIAQAARDTGAMAQTVGQDLATAVSDNVVVDAVNDVMSTVTEEFGKVKNGLSHLLNGVEEPSADTPFSRASLGLAQRLGDLEDPETIAIRELVDQRKLNEAVTRIRALPESRRMRASRVASLASDEVTSCDDVPAYESEGSYNTTAIAFPAADASVLVGLNAEVIAIAFDDRPDEWFEACPELERLRAHYVFTVGWSIGASVSASGAVTVGEWTPMPHCLAGSSYGLVIAADGVIGFSQGAWYSTADARGDEFVDMVTIGIVANDTPETGRTLSVGVGLGAEFGEYNNTWSVQFPHEDAPSCD